MQVIKSIYQFAYIRKGKLPIPLANLAAAEKHTNTLNWNAKVKTRLSVILLTQIIPLVTQAKNIQSKYVTHNANTSHVHINNETSLSQKAFKTCQENLKCFTSQALYGKQEPTQKFFLGDK